MSENPKVGLVIGTFAATPYIHLHLEVLRHWGSKIPVLVHDDASSKQEELKALCEHYGVSFATNPEHLSWRVGDYSSIVHGLEWAHERGLDLLVKMSRRFIPLYDWVPDLQALCMAHPAATYSSRCDTFNFAIRSECIAFHVPQWMPIIDYMEDAIKNRSMESGYPENFIFGLAQKVSSSGFVRWDRMLSSGRKLRQLGVLWHDIDVPADYSRAACAFGLNCTPEDFENPDGS